MLSCPLENRPDYLTSIESVHHFVTYRRKFRRDLAPIFLNSFVYSVDLSTLIDLVSYYKVEAE
jgi:hypothetical protein